MMDFVRLPTKNNKTWVAGTSLEEPGHDEGLGEQEGD
jgi:hypothetical protein